MKLVITVGFCLYPHYTTTTFGLESPTSHTLLPSHCSWELDIRVGRSFLRCQFNSHVWGLQFLSPFTNTRLSFHQTYWKQSVISSPLGACVPDGVWDFSWEHPLITERKLVSYCLPISTSHWDSERINLTHGHFPPSSPPLSLPIPSSVIGVLRLFLLC